ncbi:TolC family protein, partial [Pyxidicoccus sp. 3LFB2]
MSSRPTLFLLALLSAPALAAPSEPEAPPTPPRFEAKVDDPMLAPPPSAAEQVGSWEEALGLLRGRSTDLRTAEAGVERAQGRWRQALSALLPNARATAGVALDILNPETPVVAGGGGLGPVVGGSTGSGREPTTPLGTASVTLTQSLVDVGAWRGASSARAAEDSAQASLHDVQRRLTQGLASALVATVAAERAAEINRVGLRQALERAALSQRSMELGASTQLDVMRVRQDVEVAREALVAGDEQLRRAREALGAGPRRRAGRGRPPLLP